MASVTFFKYTKQRPPFTFLAPGPLFVRPSLEGIKFVKYLEKVNELVKSKSIKFENHLL